MKKPSVKRIKKEKRDQPLEPAGMNRRRFLTYLGTGSAALAAASSGILAGCAETEEQGAQEQGPSEGQNTSQTSGGSGGNAELFFEPIEPSDADELRLPEGFTYDIIRKWGDRVAPAGDYGYNNDFVAYFPIDTLEGGDNSEDGILWVNHEYIDAKWVSDYQDPGNTTRKTPEQIALEKAAVGGSIFDPLPRRPASGRGDRGQGEPDQHLARRRHPSPRRRRHNRVCLGVGPERS